MTANSIKLILFSILMTIVWPTFSSSKSDAFVSVNEQLFLMLDRNVYCVGETVYFRIFNISNDRVKNVEWSKVVNVEIISPSGKKVVGGKFTLSNEGAKGSLPLSENILSGSYYLRAYTKWMRNNSECSYSYEGIKIINPFKTEVLKPFSKDYKKATVKADTIYSDQSSDFVIDKNKFNRNQNVKVNVLSLLQDYDGMETCVSIVKKGSVSENTLRFCASASSLNNISFIPEFKGVSISGKVINKVDSLPIPFANVWLTMQSNEDISNEVMCNELGEFTIDLGEVLGVKDLFFSASSDKLNSKPVVLIDNDYAFSSLNLPFSPVINSVQERDIYNEMIVLSQLNQFYQIEKDKESRTEKAKDSNHFFYGKPDFTLNIKEFIHLPTVLDYIRELLPMVNVKKDHDGKFLHITGVYPELTIYKPLVMIDMVKINNVSEILTLSPSLLDRIEVIRIPYLRGDISYGGIIHFVSKDADFAQIEFEEESFFISYALLDTSISNSIYQPNNRTIPFVGNCLYWDSNLKFTNNTAEIQFHTGSEPGSYVMKIEGLNNEFKPYCYKANIEIE